MKINYYGLINKAYYTRAVPRYEEMNNDILSRNNETYSSKPSVTSLYDRPLKLDYQLFDKIQTTQPSTTLASSTIGRSKKTTKAFPTCENSENFSSTYC